MALSGEFFEQLRTHPARLLWRLNVQMKFFFIALPLILLLVSGAFAMLQFLFFEEQQTALAQRQAKTSASLTIPLSESLRKNDANSIGRLLQSIVSDPSFAGALVLDADGLKLAQAGKPLDMGASTLIRSQAIRHAGTDGAEKLGTLVTQMSTGPLNAALAESFRKFLIMICSLTVGLGLAVAIAYRRTVGVPLDIIIQAVDRPIGRALPEAVAWQSTDDLGKLAQAIDAYQAREWLQMRELEQINTDLESRISERTRELSTALAEVTAKSEEVRLLAMQDSLTGLGNRRAFTDRLDDAVAQASSLGQNFYVILIDLDNLKIINDTFGHSAGDTLLELAAARLLSAVDGNGFVARLGGDEFAILSERGGRELDAVDLANAITKSFALPVRLGEKRMASNASMGICCFPDLASSANQIMARADMALYRAKAERRGRYCLFNAKMRDAIRQADEVAVEFRAALAKGQITLHYQPQYRIRSGELVGFEALVRWLHPRRGTILPAAFLPIAAKLDLIHELGESLVFTALSDIGQWLDQGLDPGTISFNLHPNELIDHDHMNRLIEMIINSGLPPERFVMEITEDCVVDQGTKAANDILHAARNVGISLSLDDFGTGYASLMHLQELPISEIKLDKGFIAGISAGNSTSAIVSAVAFIAESMGLRLVAEGIETAEHVELLSSFEDIIGQGYHLGRPMDRNRVADLLWQGRDLRSAEASRL
jgi:diguanylate cyclase (GGDEF)-like protein